MLNSKRWNMESKLILDIRHFDKDYRYTANYLGIMVSNYHPLIYKEKWRANTVVISHVISVAV